MILSNGNYLLVVSLAYARTRYIYYILIIYINTTILSTQSHTYILEDYYFYYINSFTPLGVRINVINILLLILLFAHAHAYTHIRTYAQIRTHTLTPSTHTNIEEIYPQLPPKS